ncbi:MAG: HPr family phosphocarrier protein [Victivallales bacterium]|nr:HPr family phosphocarrier protein [Victivallales bacterium]MCF7889220.1 HPr family phosphocarrier protein [Victivallales bacterium]
MYKKEIEITCKNGLHTRPASRIVKTAKEFESKITVICDGQKASAKSLFKFQLLSLENGKMMTIEAEGSDEEQAVKTLARLIKELE